MVVATSSVVMILKVRRQLVKSNWVTFLIPLLNLVPVVLRFIGSILATVPLTLKTSKTLKFMFRLTVV